jgi:C1A family cysteine protease
MAPPSRLFLYYNARVRDNAADKDDGVSIRDAIKAAADPGACAETLWPYDATKVCVKPAESAYGGAEEKIATYFRIDQNIDHMKACIAEGFPFLFGTQIFLDQFVASQKSAVYDVPPAGATAVGGHAMVAVGYDNASFTVLNSGGSTWGKNGFVTMPFAYFSNPQWTYDFWTIRSLK